jgi:hypothetical protein
MNEYTKKDGLYYFGDLQNFIGANFTKLEAQEEAPSGP